MEEIIFKKYGSKDMKVWVKKQFATTNHMENYNDLNRMSPI